MNGVIVTPGNLCSKDKACADTANEKLANTTREFFWKENANSVLEVVFIDKITQNKP